MAKRAGTKAGDVAVAEPPKGGRGGRGFRGGRGTGFTTGAAKNRHLVIVESPSKAKTINKFLGSGYLVLASVGHVRDLPSRNPKGVKSPVPGVDLKHQFKPTYEIVQGKDKVVSDLKRAAKESMASGKEVWFATDLDREGEAIAWHLAQELGVSSKQAKRVIFAAITKGDIANAFAHPHPIDEDRVNAQQARRILDRIVGYQVSPLLWKKVARGLSAGRVQSVAVRLVVEREREIRAFIPDEYWAISACFALSLEGARMLGPDCAKFLAQKDEKGTPPTLRVQNAWLNKASAVHAELVEVGGEKFDLRTLAADQPEGKPIDLTARVLEVAKAAGISDLKAAVVEDEGGGCWPRIRPSGTAPMTKSSRISLRRN